MPRHGRHVSPMNDGHPEQAVPGGAEHLHDEHEDLGMMRSYPVLSLRSFQAARRFRGRLRRMPGQQAVSGSFSFDCRIERSLVTMRPIDGLSERGNVSPGRQEARTAPWTSISERDSFRASTKSSSVSRRLTGSRRSAPQDVLTAAPTSVVWT